MNQLNQSNLLVKSFREVLPEAAETAIRTESRFVISAEDMQKHRLVAGESLTVVEGDDGVYYLSKKPNSSCETLRKTKASTKRFLAD